MLRLYLYARVRLLLFFARETAGAASTRRSLRPLFLVGETIFKARAKRAAGRRRCVLWSLRGAPATKGRRTPPPFEASAALRHLRVTAARERHPCATVTRERHPCATATRERHPCATALPLSLEVRASSASLEGWRGRRTRDRQRNDRWVWREANRVIPGPVFRTIPK
jgi:hypothetical protein